MNFSSRIITNLLLLLMLHASGFLYGQNRRYDTIRYAREHYLKRVSDFKKEPVKRRRIIFLGNSITEFGNWKELLQDTSVMNRGVAGDNTFGILERLDEVLLQRPSLLFVEAGINDISQNIPLEIIAGNIFRIANRVKKELPDTKLYICSVLPTNDNAKREYPDAHHKNHVVVELDRLLQLGAKENQFTYIDLVKIFSGRDGKLSTQFADEDGLHLNQAGYQAWINLLKRNNYLK